MKIFSDDGKKFENVDACKEYEAKKYTDRVKLLDSIEEIHKRIMEWTEKESDLIKQYVTKYPDDAEELLSVIEWNEDEDEDEDEDRCAECDDYDACVVQAAFDYVRDFEAVEGSFKILRDLIHELD